MDQALGKRLEKIEEQIGVVYDAEENYLTLEAAEEHIKANLIAKSGGTSQAARQTSAEATQEWAEFSKTLAVAKAIFHREKHTLDLKTKAFDAEYITFKIENQAITRQK